MISRKLWNTCNIIISFKEIVSLLKGKNDRSISKTDESNLDIFFEEFFNDIKFDKANINIKYWVNFGPRLDESMNYWLVPILAQVVIPLEEAKTALIVSNFIIILGSLVEPI